MLRKAIAAANHQNPALPAAKKLFQNGVSRVLDAHNAGMLNWSNNKNRWIAEEIRFKILNLLVSLEYCK